LETLVEGNTQPGRGEYPKHPGKGGTNRGQKVKRDGQGEETPPPQKEKTSDRKA